MRSLLTLTAQHAGGGLGDPKALFGALDAPEEPLVRAVAEAAREVQKARAACEREQMLARFRERRAATQESAGKNGTPAPESTAERLTEAREGAKPAQAPTTIDSLFGPLATTESTGRVWLYVGGQLKPVRLRLGLADASNTEYLRGQIEAYLTAFGHFEPGRDADAKRERVTAEITAAIAAQ